MVKGMMKNDTHSARADYLFAWFWSDESGATAIEYAMIASGVGAVIAASITLLGGGVKNFFDAVSNAYK